VIREVVTDALLGLAALTVALSAVGILVMPDAFARLHYVTPAAVVAPVLVTLAIFVREGPDSKPDSNTGQTVIALVVMIAVSPFLSHATLRAIRARADGDVGDPLPQLTPDEPDRGERR
jgi:multisubunit Na+/H+ antiporter MnhG subunit